MRRRIFTGCLGIVLLLLLFAFAAVVFVYAQAQRTPSGKAEYVALGSSFAAGAGLGSLQDSSPLLCARSSNGYPQQLAKMRKLSIVDMSCGGAVTKHLLTGGQFFQGPQIRVIGPETRLVTITVGGNDVGYVGDTQMLAARHSGTVPGWLASRFWNGPSADAERDYAGFERQLGQLLQTIHSRAPAATVVVAAYPAILPQSGSCNAIKLTDEEVSLMRGVGDRLAAATRAAAKAGGAILVDMNQLGAGHDACSSSPWVKGAVALSEAPFHPTLEGARATAGEISKALDHQQL